jgi:hypothetical protein
MPSGQSSPHMDMFLVVAILWLLVELIQIQYKNFHFATDSNATDVGDLTASKKATALDNQDQHLVMSSGGNYAGPYSLNVIEKFPFSADSNATDVGDLTVARNLLLQAQQD